MALFNSKATLKRLRNRYRLVIMNDDTYEEVVTFRLTRLGVYIMFSTIFVVLVGFTVALITFTDLKYYLPGYGSQAQRKELIELKTKIDSLELASKYKEQYIEGIKKVLSGDIVLNKDTTLLQVPQVENSQD